MLLTDFTECYAVPGASCIIDGINPETGLTMIFGHTPEQVLEREPNAVRMTWEAWRAAQASKQDTPIRWMRTTEKQYNDMLNVLPPAAWISSGFLVGEPTDHSYTTGRPRFAAYRMNGVNRYEASTRPLTIAEFKAQMGVA